MTELNDPFLQVNQAHQTQRYCVLDLILIDHHYIAFTLPTKQNRNIKTKLATKTISSK